MTWCLASSSHPVRDRRLAHADRLSDLRRRQPDGVRLDGQLNPSRCTLAKKRLGLSELVEELLSASLVGNGLPRLAGPSWRRRHDHRCVPICETSVGTALARPVGTWKDPTRISLGPRSHGVNLRGMVCDRQVAHSTVNDDRCLPCSQVIVLSTLPPATGTPSSTPMLSLLHVYEEKPRIFRQRLLRIEADSNDQPDQRAVLRYPDGDIAQSRAQPSPALDLVATIQLGVPA